MNSSKTVVEPQASGSVTTPLDSQAKTKSKKLKWIILGILALGLVSGGLFVYNKYVGFPALFVSTKKPMNVTPVLGKKGKSEDIVAKTGGTLVLSGNKAKYTLNFPPKSLMKGERITVTEVKNIKGLKVGWKYVNGVQVEPSNAMIGNPATLTIDTKGAKGNLAAFSYSDDGKDFHFVSAEFKNGVATIPVYHFSGFGILDLGSAKPVAGEPSAGFLRYEAARRAIEAEAAVNNGGGIEENDPYAKRLYNLLHAWYAANVKPGLQNAISTGEGADNAVLEFERFKARTMRLPGGEKALATETEEGMNLSARAIKAGVDIAYTKCKNNRDATKAGVMIRLMALAEFDDFQGRVPGITDDEIKKKVASCATFKITVKSHMSTNLEGSIYSETASGEGMFTTNDDLRLSGQGKITVTGMEFGGMACTFNETDNFKLQDVSLIFEGNKKAELTMQIWPDDGDKYDCIKQSDSIDFRSSGDNTAPWWGEYANAHDDELPSFASDMFTMKGWEIINQNGVYARKVYNRTRTPSKVPALIRWVLNFFGGIPAITDNTTWEMIHMPK